MRRMGVVMAAAAAMLAAAPAQAAAGYTETVLASGPQAYWRMSDASGTVATDASGHVAGTYAGGVGLGARGALSGDANAAARFDGVDDELHGSVSATGTLEGWFFWEAGVALLRDSTSTAGWILAFDNGGKVAYRVGGATFTTSLATSGLRDGWHHIVMTVAGGATAFYVDGALEHSGSGAGSAAPAMPWHVMRNGTTAQYTRGRADEVAVYGTLLDAVAVRAHFEAGRDVMDKTAPAVPGGLSASARLGSVVLDWADSQDADLDGYDVFRATSPAGPYSRVNSSRLAASAFTDNVSSGSYVYAVTASDEADNRSAPSASVSASPVTAEDLLVRYSPQLRYESQETYFADSAAEMTDNFTSSRQNYLVSGGVRLAAANPADPLANLSLSFLGDPSYADGRAATTSDYLDAANTSYQQDAQRMRAAGYGDRVYGRVAVSGGRTWLQYWLFYYYNPQNVLGFGVHEGDWEFMQVALDADGTPETATYAQHDSGERCSWAQIQKSAGAPVVYVALASHSSYVSAGVHGRGALPDDNHRGGGYAVRPRLEIVTTATPFMAWRGKWGASSSSPVAPRRQGKWGDPAGFQASAAACSVGAAASRADAPAPPSSVPAPRISARRSGSSAVVSYRWPGRRALPDTLLVSVASAAAPDVATARRVRVRERTARVRLALPRGDAFTVSASAFDHDGTRSRIVSASLG